MNVIYDELLYQYARILLDGNDRNISFIDFVRNGPKYKALYDLFIEMCIEISKKESPTDVDIEYFTKPEYVTERLEKQIESTLQRKMDRIFERAYNDSLEEERQREEERKARKKAIAARVYKALDKIEKVNEKKVNPERVSNYRSLIKNNPFKSKMKITDEINEGQDYPEFEIDAFTDRFQPSITGGDNNIRDTHPSLFAEDLEDVQITNTEPSVDTYYQQALVNVIDFIDNHIDVIDRIHNEGMIHRDLPIAEPMPDVELDFPRQFPQIDNTPEFANAGEDMIYNSMNMFNYLPIPRRQFTPYTNALSQFEPSYNEPERPLHINIEEEQPREVDYENPEQRAPIPVSYSGRKFDIFPPRRGGGPPNGNPGGGGNPHNYNPLLYNGAPNPEPQPDITVDWKLTGPIMLASYLVNKKLYGLITNNLDSFIKKLQQSYNNDSYISKVINWLSSQIDIAKKGANNPRAIDGISKRAREVIDGLSKYSTEHFDDYPKEITPALENLNKTVIQRRTPMLYPTSTPTLAPTPTPRPTRKLRYDLLEVPTPTPTPLPTPTPTLAPTPTPSQTPRPTRKLRYGLLEAPTPTPKPTMVATPMRTLMPTPMPTPTPTRPPIMTPTPTPEPTSKLRSFMEDLVSGMGKKAGEKIIENVFHMPKETPQPEPTPTPTPPKYEPPPQENNYEQFYAYPGFGNSPYASGTGGESAPPPPLVVYYPVKKRNAAKIHRRRVI